MSSSQSALLSRLFRFFIVCSLLQSTWFSNSALACIILWGCFPTLPAFRTTARSAARFYGEGGVPLCDPAIVRETCMLFGEKAPLDMSDHIAPDISKSENIIYASTLSFQLQVHITSVKDFFAEIGVRNLFSNQFLVPGDSFAVTCSELCSKVVDNLPQKKKPPFSDVIGYRRPDGSINWDIEASQIPRILPNTSRTNGFEHVENPEVKEPLAKRLARWTKKLEIAKARPEAEKPYLEMVVANLFRIYPPANINVIDDPGDASDPSEKSDKAALEDCFQAVQYSVPALGVHHIWATCKCPAGTVVSGADPACGHGLDKERRKFNPDKLKGKGCTCRRPQLEASTVCKDTGRHCQTHAASQCHISDVQDACPRSCGLDCKDLLTVEWRSDVWKVGALAQAHVTRVLRTMGLNAATAEMNLWFGRNDQAARKEVLRIINGLNRMLLNMEFRYPGDRCSNTTYAYVFPMIPHNKNKRGQNIVYLCPLYMHGVSLGEQIETLTHEGSHHAPMRTTDVCLDGKLSNCGQKNMAYGRSACEMLAQRWPRNALKNADTYCYFISDVARRLPLASPVNY